MKEIKQGDRFRAKWVDGALCTVISVNTAENSLEVEINPQEPDRQSWVEDNWNLQHTLWGFDDGSYYEYKPAAKKTGVGLAAIAGLLLGSAYSPHSRGYDASTAEQHGRKEYWYPEGDITILAINQASADAQYQKIMKKRKS